jgi:hypothetical protein
MDALVDDAVGMVTLDGNQITVSLVLSAVVLSIHTQ